MRVTSPFIQPKPSVTSYSHPRSAMSCMPTQMPRKGRPRVRTQSSSASTIPSTAGQAAPAIRKGAPTRQHNAVGTSDPIGIAGHGDLGRKAGLASGALEGFGRRMQIAGSVVNNGDVHRAPPGSGNKPTISDPETVAPGTLPVSGIAAAEARGDPCWFCPIQMSKNLCSADSMSSPTTIPALVQPRRARVKRRSVAASNPTRSASSAPAVSRTPNEAPMACSPA